MTFLRVVTLAIMYVAASTAIAKTVEVIEYRNASLGHYFMTSDVAEIHALDSGQMPGWTRTGQKFDAYPGAHTGASPVCRYYIPPALGRLAFLLCIGSGMRAGTQQVPVVPGRVDGGDVHSTAGCDAWAACPAGDTPVYRVWNNRADSNHRYHDRSRRSATQMVAQGSIAEGYGPNQVIMCAPPHDDDPEPVASTLPPPCKGNNPRVAVAERSARHVRVESEPEAAAVPGQGRHWQTM